LPSVRPLRPVERNVSGAPRHHTDNLDPVFLGSALVSTGQQAALTGSRHALQRVLIDCAADQRGSPLVNQQRALGNPTDAHVRGLVARR